jgi:hypothetical protein
MAVVGGNARQLLKGRRFHVQTIVVGGIMCAIGFYIGLMLGTVRSTGSSGVANGACLFANQQDFDTQVQAKVDKISDKYMKTMKTDDTASRFPKQVEDFVVGMGRINRDEFAETFDMGVPLDKSKETNEEVLIMYSQAHSMPSNPFPRKEAESMTELPLLDVKDATKNCDFLNVILTDHSKSRRQCIALFGQYEAFHIQKWMRLPEHGKLDGHLPLRLVNRGAQSSGRKSTKPPTEEATASYWKTLQTYLGSLDSVLKKLAPIAKSVAVNNTIVVLVCNFGQSELLMNFICHARSRGLDLSSILVFATDEETRELAQGLGVTAFFDETNYGEMPKDAARRYADNTFMQMMMAKVFCVQMISMLGYDILFQDVDVVWYKNPLEYFHNSSNSDKDFDIYFQDDGNHALYYAPYSANTGNCSCCRLPWSTSLPDPSNIHVCGTFLFSGFYYVRNNDKTRYFFNSFLLAGDLVRSTRSHQVPLVALLNEHASMYGLKVKVFSRDGDNFPGGHAFHRRKPFMKDIISGAVKPYIFHMSWTTNKKNKFKFMQQFGVWLLNDQCAAKSASNILGSGYQKGNESSVALIQPCCASEPNFVCHYRDKPSMKPCKESPNIDGESSHSFW